MAPVVSPLREASSPARQRAKALEDVEATEIGAVEVDALTDGLVDLVGCVLKGTTGVMDLLEER